MGRWMGLVTLALAMTAAGCGDDAAQAPAADDAAAMDTGPVLDVAQQEDVQSGAPDMSASSQDAGETGCAGCLVDDACIGDGGVDPADPCRLCVADGKGGAFVGAVDGTACTAAHACVLAACQSGVCVGEPRDCGDGDPCTSDTCEPASGCVHAAVDGACDDGDACTVGESCEDGACVPGPAPDCDDEDQCTTDACDSASGCTHAPATGAPCDDGDACTDDESCQDAACVSPTEQVCDDEDPCTADACNPFTGCVHLPTDGACDDGNACTEDACDGGACVYVDAADGLDCDDGNACTVGDACAAGACAAGGAPLECDDGNPCTVEGCEPAKGCTYAAGPAGVPCDDEVECTFDDLCQASSKCKGTPLDCGPCEPEFEPSVLVATSLLIAPDGQPGNGLDVDQNPATCAPGGSCSVGIDNAGAPLGSLINDGLDGAVQKGQLAYLVELVWPLGPPEGTFVLNLYAGQPTVDGCVPSSGGCVYQVWPEMIDPDTCAPLTSFTNATYVGGVLKAGGPTFSFPLSLPILPGANLDVTIEGAQIQGKVTIGAGGKPSTFVGVIGGAVRQDVLIAAIYQIPADVLILPPDQLVSLMTSLLVLDIDTDGDGAKDAYSVGFKATAQQATVTGLVP